VIRNRISFPEPVDQYALTCSSLVSRIALENKWRQFAPSDRKWRSIDLWYSKWLGLAGEVDELGENQKKEQFDAVLLNFIPNLIKEIHREELAGNALSLEQRWNYVSKQMKLKQLLNQIQSAFSHHPTAGIPSFSVNALQKAKN
jgi:hypothetical protein